MGTTPLMTLVCAILVMILRTNEVQVKALRFLIVVFKTTLLETYDLINSYHQ